MKKTVLLILFNVVVIVFFSLFISCSEEDDDGLLIKGVVDIDGNFYDTITIGSQVWMTENLKVTRLNDGSQIKNVLLKDEWRTELKPAYCWFNNDIANKDISGAYYNWYAASSQKLCPQGWHVASDIDWKILEDYLRNNGYQYGDNNAAIAKALADTSGWKLTENEGAVGNNQIENNTIGFNAMPTGQRYEGVFTGKSTLSIWWTDTNYDSKNAWIRLVQFSNANLIRFYISKNLGASVRCVKD